MAARNFHPFPHLIPELRNEIWGLAAGKGDERIVVVLFDSDRMLRDNQYLDWKFSCTSPTRLPVTFHVNQESRYESMRIYRNVLQLGTGPKIYFSSVHDRIFLDSFSIYSMYMFLEVREELERGSTRYDAEQFAPGVEVGFENIKNLAVTFSTPAKDIPNKALHALRREDSILAGVTGEVLQKTDVPRMVPSWDIMQRNLKLMYRNTFEKFCPFFTETSDDWPVAVLRARLAEEGARIRLLNGLVADAEFIFSAEQRIAHVDLDE